MPWTVACVAIHVKLLFVLVLAPESETIMGGRACLVQACKLVTREPKEEEEEEEDSEAACDICAAGTAFQSSLDLVLLLLLLLLLLAW